MTVRATRLDNGVRVVTHEMPHLASAALGAWVRAGSRSETDGEHGISHLLEHMAFKGTSRRSAKDIAEEIENVGGELNAATGVESTAYYARVLEDDVPLAVDIIADILTDSVFEADELAREQHVIVQEIGAVLDSPDDLVFDMMQETAFAGQPLGRSILGTADSVTNFSGDDLRTYLANNYDGGHVIVSAAGSVDHDEMVGLVEERFDRVADGDATRWRPADYVGGERRAERDLKEVHICLGLKGQSYRSDDFYATQVLSSVLGGGMSSRLFQEIREKRGLCYSIYSFHWGFDDTGLFGVHAATSPEDVTELMDVLVAETVGAVDSFGDREIARAKAQLRAGLLMSFEAPSARAGQIARQHMIFDRALTVDEISAKIEAVTVDDVRRMGRAIITSSAPTLAAVGILDDVPAAPEIAHRLGYEGPLAAE